MKVAAIYNIFDGEEHLEESIDPWFEDKDTIIIAVVQQISNYGEKYRGGVDESLRLARKDKIDCFKHFTPDLKLSGAKNETKKRNIGLSIAIKNGCTHFITLDCDEIWLKKDIPSLKKQTDTAHRMLTYIKNKNLVLSPLEDYFVPGILSLNSKTKVGNFNTGLLCDPTRSVNYKLKLGKAYMHHYSFIRNNMRRKVQNSSAKKNILPRLNILEHDLKNAKEGYFSEYFGRTFVNPKNLRIT